MESSPARPGIGLVGPAPDQPCGIADYVRRLEPALAARCRLIRVSFQEALTEPALDGCRAILVHYERGLVPAPDYLARLAERHPGKILVAPHEVYGEDPFAFPYSAIRSPFPPLLWLKRLRYRLRHREYAREKGLQRKGYHAARVIPLSREGGEILRSVAAGPDIASRILPPVPVARFDLPVPSLGALDRSLRPSLFPGQPKAVVGIFGFLNPGLDYGSAFDLIASSGGEMGLVLLGGERIGYHAQGADSGTRGGGASIREGGLPIRESGLPIREALEKEVIRRGIADRVRITGYLEEKSLADHLAICDLFLCPMRFKSSSASILQLFRQGKPILVPALPLTAYLRDEGAPLDLYSSQDELRELAAAILEGRHRIPEDRYPYDFPAVAEAYLKIAEEATSALPGSAR